MKFECEEITPLQQRYLRVFAPLVPLDSARILLQKVNIVPRAYGVERSPFTGRELYYQFHAAGRC
jgi:hypothetical protein